MNRRQLLLSTLATAVAHPITQANTTRMKISQPQQVDIDAVRVVLAQYFKGQATGDPIEMRKPFLPTAHIEGIWEGKFVSWTLDQFCNLYSGKPAADEATRTRAIDSIDIVGTAAMAKATLLHGTTTFTDYFLLLKVDGRWAIANKIYHGEKRA
jgi:hypothetical protein